MMFWLWRLIFFVFFVIGCNKQDREIKYPDRLPITEEAKELTSVPEYLPPGDGERVEPIGEGDEAPYDGVILGEDAAIRVGELRIAYDEIYQLNLAGNKYLLSVIAIQERELYRADQVVAQRDDEIDRVRNSWWNQNKLYVGMVTGMILGVGISISAGKIWSEMDR